MEADPRQRAIKYTKSLEKEQKLAKYTFYVLAQPSLYQSRPDRARIVKPDPIPQK